MIYEGKRKTGDYRWRIYMHEQVFNTMLQGVGKTPLVKLGKINNTGCEIYVKLESRNPAGSIKDRIAVYMVERALELREHCAAVTIVEPTSGNTGIALALLSAVRGFRCILTMPESMSVERQKLLRAYGAEVVLTPATEGMEGAVRKAEELCANTELALYPNQFANPHVVEAHYKGTGPEILAQCRELSFSSRAPLDALVAGVGTGGTISGTGLFLREHLPHIRLVAVEPTESPLLSEGRAGAHGIQGIGANFVPSIVRRDLLDEVMQVSTQDALHMSRALFRQEGISCGISSGANVCAALRLAARAEMRGKRIVTFICDGGERYMSTALFDNSA